MRGRGGPSLSRRFLCQPVVVVVEDGEHVALMNVLADLHLALGNFAGDTECLIHLVARLHGAGVAVGLTNTVVAELDGAHRAWRLRRRFARTTGAEHGGDGQGTGRGK